MTDVISLLQDMIRCPSVTPKEAGVLGVLEKALIPMGFVCERLIYGEGEERVENLFAKKGTGRPHFCFAGHVDVVPVGGEWTHPPFGAEIEDGRLYGRGAMDMKSGVAAFIKALEGFEFDGSISLLITGNEEGKADYGTPSMLTELAARGEKWDVCLVGEPSGNDEERQVIKTGRRGSLNAVLKVSGAQGHSAYPEKAVNAVEALMDMLTEIRKPLDSGSNDFDPSTLAVTSVDVGNPVSNIIPGYAAARFNARFNDCHTAESLDALIRERIRPVAERTGASFDLETECSSNAFVIQDRAFPKLVADAIEEIAGYRPGESTSGGTSDARFIRHYCPVLESGLVGKGMHGIDESVAVDDVRQQVQIYRRILEKFFKK